jgi:hypothetical protein
MLTGDRGSWFSPNGIDVLQNMNKEQRRLMKGYVIVEVIKFYCFVQVVWEVLTVD